MDSCERRNQREPSLKSIGHQLGFRNTMGRFKSLLRDTWWLWLLFVVGGLIASTLISPIFLLIFPVSIFTFFWFAYIRYDEEGNFKGT